MMEPPAFTVFTPTFNRAHTLPNVYRSLCCQTFQDFEWLIVDDGSSDGTDSLVRAWQEEARLTIRYFYQSNAGKHVAFNRGVEEANGVLFLTLDSDDVCVPKALERLYYHWNCLPTAIRSEFSGITCLCMDQNQRIIGTPFPCDAMDSDPVTLETRYRVKGDKWGFHRTEILKRFPFPVFPGERFCPEGLVWNRIAREFKLRFVNEPLRICEYLADGLSAFNVRNRANSPKGTCLYYSELMSLPVTPWFLKFKAASNLWRFNLLARTSIEIWHNLIIHSFCMSIAFPIGLIAATKDKIKISRTASCSLP